MQTFRFVRVVKSAFAGAVGIGAMLCLTQCVAEQGDAENIGTVSQPLEQCGGVACAANVDCVSSTVMPLCASSAGATCLATTPRECSWRLSISSSCPCMEHAVRLCTQGNGSPGVQICTANNLRTATYWAACAACPSCAP